jgi:predicted RNA binding protein YcfA (HicA-like mRNA interferase family)
MKRIDLIRDIEKNGCVFVRSGANHDIYLNPRTGKKQPIPRHREIDESLARHIKKILA